MAFPTIEDITQSTHVDESSHAISYPATVGSGDLLIVGFGCDDNEVLTWQSGWNVIYEEDAGAQGPTLGVAWKEADGTEGGGSFNIQTGTSEGSCAHLIRITGHQTPGVNDPEASVEGAGSSQNPDALSLTASGGSKEFLIICFEVNDDDDNVTVYPRNMTSKNQYAQVATATAGIATTVSETNVFDPNQFTIAASESWEAATIMVYPYEFIPPPSVVKKSMIVKVKGKVLGLQYWGK
jgi:hypothetical protein